MGNVYVTLILFACLRRDTVMSRFTYQWREGGVIGEAEIP